MEGTRRRGRPRKDIDLGVIFHMIKNGAEITKVAKHLGIHRDTIYANYRYLVNEALVLRRKTWREIMEVEYQKREVEAQKKMEERRLKEIAKRLERRLERRRRRR
jgi:predicted transcriptional regulator